MAALRLPSARPPGGHLEFGESPIECAIRETNEETGLILDPKTIIEGPWTNDIFEKEKRHYVTLFVLAPYERGEPQLKESDKFLEWKWFNMNDLPEPLFLPNKNLLAKVTMQDLQQKLLTTIKK